MKNELVQVIGNFEETFAHMAAEMLAVIEGNNTLNRFTVMIVPVGPIAQYAPLAKMINEKRVSLKYTYLINMDEYLDGQLNYISCTHELSFRRFMQENFYDKIDAELIMPQAQRIFPNPNQLLQIGEIIDKYGLDACFGGIGINGHIAFNEPEQMPVEEFCALKTRVVALSEQTRVINQTGEITHAVTVGINEIMRAKRIRLYCFREWHRAVVQNAGAADISAQFPATVLRRHDDFKICVTADIG